MRLSRLLICGVLVFAASSVRAQSRSVAADAHQKDRELIRAHIESIFQAFIDWDVDKIYATHSEDWRGFLEGSQVPIKGIDEYMRANGIDWPAKGHPSKPTPDPSRGYRVKDFDVNFLSPDLAVVSFVGEFENRSGAVPVTTNRLHLMDIYARRNGNWIQVASHTVVDPEWRMQRETMPASVGPRMRQQILQAREAVWRAYFSNDRTTLEKLIPDETIAIDAGSEGWNNRASILAGAKGLAESGAKLVRLEFPKTEMQVYGNTIILYTTYLTEVEANGRRDIRTGRGTEIFVRRGDTLVNVGWHLDAGK